MSLQKEFVETTQQPAKQQMEAEHPRSWRHPHDIPAISLAIWGENVFSSPCTRDSKPQKSLKRLYEEKKDLFKKIAPLCQEKKHHYLTCKVNYAIEIEKLLTAVLLKSVFTYHVK